MNSASAEITKFNYQEFTTRNIGFVTPEEQQRLSDACVFVCGTGGMGGAALMVLARAGVGRFIIADIDDFEISNLNRQVFATLDTVGQHKASASRDKLLLINPQARIEVLDKAWSAHVDDLISSSDVVINGTDDLAASLLLYRRAQAQGRPVIDAYASPLPSVYVTRPEEATPEERLGYPTGETTWNEITKAQRDEAFLAEAIHILIHSPSRHYIDLDAAGEVAAGRRSRMSFAPMVITTGNLMAYETVALILDKPTGTTNVGWFFNPYRPAVEKPYPALVAALMRPVVKRLLARMMGTS